MISIISVHIGIIGVILGLYWGNGKENGNYYSDRRPSPVYGRVPQTCAGHCGSGQPAVHMDLSLESQSVPLAWEVSEPSSFVSSWQRPRSMRVIEISVSVSVTV